MSEANLHANVNVRTNESECERERSDVNMNVTERTNVNEQTNKRTTYLFTTELSDVNEWIMTAVFIAKRLMLMKELCRTV